MMIKNQNMRCVLLAIMVILGYGYNTVLLAQCNLNSCGVLASVSADAPVFNAANRAIQINNIKFDNASCSATEFIVGIDFYVYQIMPNGQQVRNCNVINPIPNNILGVAHLDLGNKPICNQNFNLGNITIGANAGFEICDGGRYQIEMALYATTVLNFKSLDKTVDSELNSSEYKLINLGIVETNITQTFSNGQPLIATEISNWSTRSNSTIVVPCNTDVDMYIQGQSIIADCAPFGDFSNAIPSEMTNTFSYTINGGSPIIIENSATGASGGQLTGAISSANSACYGGIITSNIPYTFEASKLANACGGTAVKFTIKTTDAFTNQSQSSNYTLIFDSCVPTLTVNNSAVQKPVYAAAQTVNAAGNIATNGNVVFQAGQLVSLNNNFNVPASANFAAIIANCR